MTSEATSVSSTETTKASAKTVRPYRVCCRRSRYRCRAPPPPHWICHSSNARNMSGLITPQLLLSQQHSTAARRHGRGEGTGRNRDRPPDTLRPLLQVAGKHMTHQRTPSPHHMSRTGQHVTPESAREWSAVRHCPSPVPGRRATSEWPAADQHSPAHSPDKCPTQSSPPAGRHR